MENFNKEAQNFNGDKNPDREKISKKKKEHREIEKRRRDMLNSALKELSEILPVKERSKVDVVTSARELIFSMRNNNKVLIEKHALEKSVLSQKIIELLQGLEDQALYISTLESNIKYLNDGHDDSTLPK